MHRSAAMRERLRQLSVFVLNPTNSAELLHSVSELDQQKFAGFLSLLD